MKTWKKIALFGLCGALYMTTPTCAADCRSEVAAKAGSQEGYERDKTAAIENEKRESASSDVIGRCIGSITSIIVVPTFPSLQQIFAQAAEKMCRVARDKIRDAATLPPTSIPGIPTASIPVPVTPVSAGQKRPTDENLLSRIWR